MAVGSLASGALGAVFDETEADYTVVVPAGKMHCYFQPMEKGCFWFFKGSVDTILGTAFEIEYQVLEGGDLDIDFQMTSPGGTLLFNELRSEEGLHEIASGEEGDYKVCKRHYVIITWHNIKWLINALIDLFQ